MTDPIETLRLYIEGRIPGGLYSLEEAMAALAELERRAKIEARRDAYLATHGPYELTLAGGAYFVTLPTPHGVRHGDGLDYWTALEKALDAAGAP